MTAEIGEHERAPRAGESCPTPLRATLRAPPSKWVIKGFFTESPCRVLSLVLSFAPKESTTPRGGSPTVRAGVGASSPRQGFAYGKVGFSRRLQGAFRSPPVPVGSPSEDGERPVERQSSTRAGVGASIPRRDFPTAEGFACDKIGAALPAVNSVCCSPSAWNLRRNPHLLVTAPVCIGCIETSKKWKNMQAGERKKHGYTPALPLKNSKRPCSFWLHGRLC